MPNTAQRPGAGPPDVSLLPRQYLVRSESKPDLFHLLTPDGRGGMVCTGPPCTAPAGERVCKHVLKALAARSRAPEPDPGPVLAHSELEQERCAAGRPHLHVV